jgi:hypothetical protein
MIKQSTLEKTPIVFFLIVLTITACRSSDSQLYQYPNYGTFEQTGDYLINPETILQSLDKNGSNIFMPVLATPGPDAQLLSPGSVPWTQLEYLKIVNALSQLVWKETMEDWDVYYLSFRRECQDNPIGFDSFDITYYKIIEVNSEMVYTARQIEIYPLASQVSWGGGSIFPRPLLGGWNSIDLIKSKITADEALKIAEENGGKEARSRVRNDCNILVRAPHNSEDSWHVSYYFSTTFEVTINPYTGEYKILNTDQ